MFSKANPEEKVLSLRLESKGTTVLYCGILLVVAGLVYLIKPDVFMRGTWQRTAVSQQVLTPNQNKNYMRVLGAGFVVVGICLIAEPYL